MESQRVVVVVEEIEAAQNALKWAIHNFIRGTDSITLVYVYPSTKSKKQRKCLRLKGFQLALSFKDLCNGIAEAKVEILVIEGEIGATVVSLANKIRASTLVVGLHDQSFLYKSSFGLNAPSLNCRILAVNQHSATRNRFISAELSQVQMATLYMPEPKIPYPIVFPCWKKSRRRRTARLA